MEHLPMAGVAGKVDHKRGQAHGTAMFYFFSISVVQWWDQKDFRLTVWLIHWLIGTGSCFCPDCSSSLLPVSASQKLGLQDGATTPFLWWSSLGSGCGLSPEPLSEDSSSARETEIRQKSPAWCELPDANSSWPAKGAPVSVSTAQQDLG